MSRLSQLVRRFADEVSDGRIVRRVPQLAKAVSARVKATLTAPMRALPDYLIVGAMKAGTSFLYWLLTQHPQVLPASDKEVNFFDYQYDRGLAWYRTNFPWISDMKKRSRETGLPTFCGEASPYYMFHPHAARRIAQHLPNVKIIMLLRNPVDRTYSHYHHQVRLGQETVSFEEAVRLEPQRLLGERERILADEKYKSFNYPGYSFMARGVYIDQVLEYHRYFPKERMLIIRSEDLFTDVLDVFYRVQDFIGMKRWTPSYIRPINMGRYKKEPGPTLDYLKEYFKPHNQRLYEYLGVDYGW
jgi:Sulfotransferase domain